jgi:hypothetical protein
MGGEGGEGRVHNSTRGSVGLPGLVAHAGGWVCGGGACDMSVCVLVRGGPLGVPVGGEACLC